MARLGQLLVRADLVSENHLARALGIQHFAGGRLGTLLLERGSIEEDNLGKTLALQHGCEYIPFRRLAEIPLSVIAALPAKFAIKHAAVPYERGENSLKVALRDPGDLRILDELFFVTGRKIIAGVAPEVRIYQALEKYYGERRTPRYAILAEKISRPARTAKAQTAVLPPPPDFFPSPRRKRPGVVPSANDIWGDAGELDQGDLPIIQSWTVPDQSIDQPVGGWAGSVSPGMEGLPIPEPETISWEEMPSIPGLWMPEPSSSAPGSELAPSSSRDSGRILFDPRSLASPARAIPTEQIEASSAPPVSPTHSEIGPPAAFPPEAAVPLPLFREETESGDKQILSAPVEAEPLRSAAPVPEETPPGPAPAEEPALPVASAVPEAEEPVFLREPAPAPAPVLPPSSPAEPAGKQAETPTEVSSIPSAPLAPSAPSAPSVPEPEPPPTEPLPVEPPQAVPLSPAPAPVSAAALAAMPSATDFPQVTAAIDRDAIATAALRALARRFVRAAVFVSRPDSVTAWGGLGEGVSAEELRDISIPWKDPSIFLNIRLSRSFYLGPLPPLPRHESIAIAMGGWPEECLIQPVYLKDKPVAFLYAEFSGDQGATPMDLAYMRELAAAASSAFVAAIRLKKREI
jgi:Type II secretion system (T2SS), protein E, N-terminal domain